jgi:queuosine precursor transporter
LIPRSLFIYSIFYGGMVTLAGVLGNKQVALGPLAVEAGIFPFLLLVITSSAVAELHGADRANLLVRFGFIPLVAAIILTWIVLLIPASPEMDPARLDGFNLVLGQSWRLMAAGIVSYGTSQTLNVYVFDRLKRNAQSFVWLRGAIAAVLSQVIDTLLFVTISFYGVFPIAELMMGQMLAKVVLSIVLVPVIIQFMVGLGRKLDRKAATA